MFDSEGTPIAVHPKLEGNERVSTLDAHYPPEKVALTRFEVKSALRLASKVGPKTEALVSDLVMSSFPLRYLRRIQGILRLHQSGVVGRESLEYACEQATLFNRKNFVFIKNAAIFFENGGAKPRLVTPKRTPGDLYLHNTKETP
jgi:hypothetical protein